MMTTDKPTGSKRKAPPALTKAKKQPKPKPYEAALDEMSSDRRPH